MPLVNRTFDQLIDFTRTSAATFVNSSGNIASTPQSRNLLTFTQEFDNAAWTKTNATVYPFDPATASVGANVVTNGDFASATGWTASAGWVIGSGVATAAATSSSLYGGFTSVSGQWYKITFDCTITSGTLIVAVGLGTSASFTTSGTKTVFLQSGASTSRGVEFYGGTVTGTVDNVVAQPVTIGLLAPDGTMTADTLVEDTTNAAHTVSSGNATVALGAVTWSVYAKAGTRSWMWLNAFAGGNNRTWFNLANGTVGTTGAGATASITSVGNGWYRCSVTLTSGTTTVSMGINAASADNTTSYAGTSGAGAIFIWGAQLEQVPDANLTLGGELISSGAIGLVGTATAATYNTGTGVGTASRVDTSNQSFVQWTGLTDTASYRFSVTNTGSSNVLVRSGNQSASVLRTVTPGETAVFYGSPVSGRITITAGADGVTSNFTLNSFRQITGTTGMPSDYTRNFGGLFPPRFDYDPVTRAPRGLLIEEQRTNLFTRSEEFDNAAWSKNRSSITANATTSPDGTADADKLVEDTSNNTHYLAQFSVNVTSGVSYTYTMYAKAAERTWAALRMETTNAAFNGGFANFNLSNGTVGSVDAGLTASITAAGNGWYRLSVTSTATATAAAALSIYLGTANNVLSYTGDGTSGIFLWGAQLEAGAFATSYIPTVASQVTRSADVAAINAPNFASWFNGVEGTIFVEAVTFKPTSVVATGLAVDVSDGGVNNRHYIGTNGATAEGRTVVGGVTQVSIFQTYTANATEKLAYAYKVNDFAFFRNGSQVGTDTSGTIPTVDRMFIGNAAGSAAFWNGWLRSIRYYPTRLTQAQGQALTA